MVISFIIKLFGSAMICPDSGYKANSGLPPPIKIFYKNKGNHLNMINVLAFAKVQQSFFI